MTRRTISPFHPAAACLRAAAALLLCGLMNCSREDKAPDATMNRAEKAFGSLRPAVQLEGRESLKWPIENRMQHYSVPGVSIAVVDGGAVVATKAFGVLKTGQKDQVTPRTLFQAASISKAVTATATLLLIDQGKLGLDVDVNEYLQSWKVPANEFTATEKVTLRRILSHTAGLNSQGFMGYPPGGPMPTLQQVLDAVPPAKNQPIRVVAVPGSVTNYSGGGTVIEQMVLTDTTKQAFAELMQALVFSPLGMSDSTYVQPLPQQLKDRAASGHSSDGSVIEGGWAIGPEMAAGWLWTTPADIMRWAIAIDAAYRGTPGAILSRQTAREMLTVQKDQYGLGPLLEGSGPAFRFSHGGNNPGYTTQVVYFPETRQGAAIFVNNGTGDLLIDEITRALATEYDWPALQPARIKQIKADDAALRSLVGKYALLLPGATEANACEIRVDNDRLVFNAQPMITDDEIVLVGPNEAVSPVWGYRITFRRTGSGTISGFDMKYGQNDMTATRAAD